MLCEDNTIIHATTVSVDGKGLIILGGSGSGKSSLAIGLLALGAELVADDQTELKKIKSKVFASPPKNLPIGIESYGLGIVKAPVCSVSVQVSFVADLSGRSEKRLPEAEQIILLGSKFPIFKLGNHKDPVSSLFLLMKYGYVDQNMNITKIRKFL